MAIIAVPADSVYDVAAECIAAGVPSAVVWAGGFAEGGDEDRRLMRLLIGSRILRRRRARRMLLGHLLRERGEAGEEEDEGEDELAEGGDNEQGLMRLLVGHRVRQSKRARRLLMAQLLREREEA